MKNLYFLMLFLAGISLNAQIVNIPDANFKAKLLSASPTNFVAQDANSNWISIDTNGDGEIQVSEALNIRHMGTGLTSIQDFTGLNSFTNLKTLIISQNSSLPIPLNLSGMNNLEYIKLYSSYFNSLNIQGCTSLNSVNIQGGAFYYLNFLQSTSIKKLHLDSATSLYAVNLSGLPNLEQLEILGSYSYNYTSLDLSANSLLKKLTLQKPNLTSLNMNGLTNLEELILNETAISSLDLSQFATKLKKIEITQNNSLASLNISNNNQLTQVTIASNNILGNVSLSNKPNLINVINRLVN